MNEVKITETVSVLPMIKTLSNSFWREPTVEKVSEISKLLDVEKDAIADYVDILYPLVYHLKINTFQSKDKNVQLIEAIQATLLKIRLDTSTLFVEIYKCLQAQLTLKDSSLELIEAHEELKEAVVMCIRDLFNSCSTNIIEECYVRPYAALISHGVYLCISLANFEKSLSLRLAALDAVMVLLQVHKEEDLQNTVLLDQIADVVMLFLPGVVRGLLEIVLNKETQNDEVTMMAIRIWSRVMVLVMKPSDCSFSSNPLLKIEDFITNNSREVEKLKNVLKKRTPDWCDEVCKRFNFIFQELEMLTIHENVQIRRELATGVSLVLLKCTRNVKLCFQTLLEILIILTEDENDEIAAKTQTALVQVQDKCLEDETMQSNLDALEEIFYDTLVKLPKIIKQSDEFVQFIWFSKLAGFLRLFGKQRLSILLESTMHLRQLLMTLICVSELDCNIDLLLDDVTATNATEYAEDHSWKQFQVRYSSSAIKKFYDVLKNLGEFGDQKILVNSIFKMTLDLPNFKKELILILNGILMVPADPAEQTSICKQVIERYTSSEFWNLSTKVTDEVTLNMAKNNIIQSCLLLEGLKVMAEVLQENYQYFVLKTFYLIIEKTETECSFVRYFGLKTLRSISKSQQQVKIGHLFEDDVNYISFHCPNKDIIIFMKL